MRFLFLSFAPKSDVKQTKNYINTFYYNKKIIMYHKINEVNSI